MADEKLVRRLIDTLKELDIYERTIIVLMSDHGTNLGEHPVLASREHAVLSHLVVRRIDAPTLGYVCKKGRQIIRDDGFERATGKPFIVAAHDEDQEGDRQEQAPQHSVVVSHTLWLSRKP